MRRCITSCASASAQRGALLPARNVVRFRLIAHALTIVGLLVIGLIFGNFGIQR